MESLLLATLRHRGSADWASSLRDVIARGGCELRAAEGMSTLRAQRTAAGVATFAAEPTQMLEILPSSTSSSAHAAASDCTAPALAHPALRGCVRRVLGRGHRLVLDTSLCGASASDDASASAAATISELPPLNSVGGYFDVAQRCVALAADSAHHELLHEMVHSRLHCADVDGPLHAHRQQLERRGFSEVGAEELVCREHELHVLRAGPLTAAAASRALVVHDSALLIVEHELGARATLDGPQRAELRRARWTRALLTSPRARGLHVLAVGTAALAAATAAFSGIWARIKR